jgi:hypothetical protein
LSEKGLVLTVPVGRHAVINPGPNQLKVEVARVSGDKVRLRFLGDRECYKVIRDSLVHEEDVDIV